MEKDNEVKGSGNSLDFGARIYDSRLGKWLSTDPLQTKYPNLTPYNFVANNPILFVDPDGRVIDLNSLSKADKENYDAAIQLLSASKLFKIIYNRLVQSNTVYTVKAGAGHGGSGSYNDETKEIFSIDDIETLAQEMFHAYQSDLGVYTPEDLSVRETEGDLMSSNIVYSIGNIPTTLYSWDVNEIVTTYPDGFDKNVLTEKFDKDFTEAVNTRIDYYRKIEEKTGTKELPSYTQDNSGTVARAIKKVVIESIANDENLQGPRLDNGDYYSE
ncbi:MAG: hypothetical protein IPK18_09870 [Sphingobacteriales bacterium]|nr:MAG: hypothetical protein IPK18_09870 [Sphingobacteriales bacterium]